MLEISANARFAESDKGQQEGEERDDDKDEEEDEQDDDTSEADGFGGGLGTRGARDLVPINTSEVSAGISSELHRECLGLSVLSNTPINSSFFTGASFFTCTDLPFSIKLPTILFSVMHFLKDLVVKLDL